MKPKRPFMIEGGPSGMDFLRITPKGRVRWVDWEGNKWATKEEAEEAMNSVNLLYSAKIIEIQDEIRVRV